MGQMANYLVTTSAADRAQAFTTDATDATLEVGQTLSADTTTIADVDGLDDVVFRYQWLADDADIAGSTYSVVSRDVGKAIRVRVAFADDGGNEETLTSAPTVVTAAGLQLQSATVDGVTLTLTYSEVLDNGVTLGTTAFAVRVNGSPRSLLGVAMGESSVLLLLSSAVEAGDTVTVGYTAPDGQDVIRDTRGRKAASFSGQAVTNDTASARTSRLGEPQDESNRLTASVSGEPSSHDGQTAFTFELRFSEEFPLSYVTLRDHAFTVTGGTVVGARRLDRPATSGGRSASARTPTAISPPCCPPPRTARPTAPSAVRTAGSCPTG